MNVEIHIHRSTKRYLTPVTPYNTSIPLIISSEGTTTISYYSTDNAGNIEETKTLLVKIDKTAPEAEVSFDPTTQKLNIIGRDKLSDVSVLNTATSSTIADEAGNTTILTFKQVKDKEYKKDKKNKERKQSKKADKKKEHKKDDEEKDEDNKKNTEEREDNKEKIKTRLSNISYKTFSTNEESIFHKNEVKYIWKEDKELHGRELHRRNLCNSDIAYGST